jgi:hypothetical protein
MCCQFTEGPAGGSNPVFSGNEAIETRHTNCASMEVAWHRRFVRDSALEENGFERKWPAAARPAASLAEHNNCHRALSAKSGSHATLRWREADRTIGPANAAIAALAA